MGCLPLSLPWVGHVGCAEVPLDVGDSGSVGRWGEALVRNYLLATLPPSHRVEWVNEHEETRAPYDVTVTPHGRPSHRGGGQAGTIFVEVKTTRHAHHNVVDLSHNEWAFLSSEPPVNYAIARVSGAGDPRSVRLTIVDNPLQAVKDGALRLCLAL